MTDKHFDEWEHDSRVDAEEGRAKPQDNSPEAVAEREYWREYYARIHRQEAESARRWREEHPDNAAAVDAIRERDRQEYMAKTGKSAEEVRKEDEELQSFLDALYG